MSINTLELRAERKTLYDETRKLLDKVQEEKRELLQEEKNTYDAKMKRMDDLKEIIDREERMAAFQREFDSAINTAQKPEGLITREARLVDSKEYGVAFMKALPRGLSSLTESEKRTMTEGAPTEGGYLVPTLLYNEIVRKLPEFNFMRNICRVINTVSTQNIPVQGNGITVSMTGETVPATESTPTLAQKTLSAFKMTGLAKLSLELIQDAAFDVQAYVSSLFAEGFADKEESKYIAGAGTTEPRGVLLDAVLGKTTASASSITPDEILDLFYSLLGKYRKNASWVMNDSTLKTIDKLKDKNDRYLLSIGLDVGAPDRLKGRPLFTSANMPEIGSATKTIVFGNFSYYWIGLRGAMTMQLLNELYAVDGLIGILGVQRIDGVLTLTEAMKYLAMHA